MSTAHSAARSTHAAHAASAAAPRPSKAPRHPGSGYTPGMYDALLPIRDHARPEELRAVTVECAGSNAVLIEHLHAGGERRYFFRPGAPGAPGTPDSLEQSWSAFIRLPTGREVWIEVRYAAAPPDEDVEPWVRSEQMQSTGADRVAFRRAF
jgi:hypothetical protein